MGKLLCQVLTVADADIESAADLLLRIFTKEGFRNESLRPYWTGGRSVIHALMIDVDGVLVSGRPSDGRHWATGLEADLGLSFAILQDAFFKRYWDEIVTGRADLHARLANVLARIAPGLTAEQVVTYWFQQDARLNPELLEDLATLRRSGLRAYLATNQEHERAHYLMSTLDLAAHLDGCCYSAAIGHRKPVPAFFDAVACKVGLPAEELLLVDDAEENIRAAIAAGWNAVQWTDRERLIDLVAGVLHGPTGARRVYTLRRATRRRNQYRREARAE